MCVNSISYKSIEYGFRDIVTCEKSYNSRISVMELKSKVIVRFYIIYYNKIQDDRPNLPYCGFIVLFQIKL